MESELERLKGLKGVDSHQLQALLEGLSELQTERRVLIGIVGKPGSGKSTFCDALKLQVVGQDGFHLANKYLVEKGLREHKGRYDTFDSRGLAALLRRLKEDYQKEDVFYPVFHREIEESFAAEGIVAADVSVVVVEGIWLLREEFGRDQFDVLIYFDLDDSVRITRLVERRIQLGFSREEGERWARGSDEENAILIEKDKLFADLLVTPN
jgi:pantothenate kinase